MNSTVVYVILNGESKMSPGKAAAQTAHAIMGLYEKTKPKTTHRRTVIVLEAKNALQLYNLQLYLSLENLGTYVYIDEGVNEIDPYSATALAVGPIDTDDEEARSLLAAFPLYPKKRGFLKR